MLTRHWCLFVLLFFFLAFGLDIPLTVKEYRNINRIQVPVTSGVPFAMGALTEARINQLIVTDNAGAQVPAQFYVINHWHFDKSIKWLLVDFQATVGPNGSAVFRLKDGGTATTGTLIESKDANGVVINTGRIKFSIRRDKFNLFDQVWLDKDNNGSYSASEQIVTSSDASGVFLTHTNNTVYSSAFGHDGILTVEEDGPLAAVVSVKGHNYNPAGSQWIYGYTVRFHAYKDKDYIKVQYIFRNTDFDPDTAANSWPLSDVSLVQKVSLTGSTATFGGDGSSAPIMASVGSGKELYQSAWSSFFGVSTGSQSEGWVDISDGSWGVSGGLREFYQNWPSAVSAKTDQVVISVLPKSSGQPHYLAPFTKKTHETFFYFHSGDAGSAKVRDIAVHFSYPLFALADRTYIASTEAWEWGLGIPNYPPPQYKTFNPAPSFQGWQRYGAISDSYGWDNGGLHDNAMSSFSPFLLSGNMSEFEKWRAFALHTGDLVIANADEMDIECGKEEQSIWWPVIYDGHICCGWNGYWLHVQKPTRWGGRVYFSGFRDHLFEMPDPAHRGIFAPREYYYLTGDRSMRESLIAFGKWGSIERHYSFVFKRGPAYSTRAHAWTLHNEWDGWRASEDNNQYQLLRKSLGYSAEPTLQNTFRTAIKHMKKERARGYWGKYNSTSKMWREESPWMASMLVGFFDSYYKETRDENIRDCIWGYSNWLRNHVGLDPGRMLPYRWMGEPLFGWSDPQWHPRAGQLMAITYKYTGDSTLMTMADAWFDYQVPRMGNYDSSAMYYHPLSTAYNVQKFHRPDKIRPDAITDLNGHYSPDSQAIVLTWTAPRDDKGVNEYIVKYTTESKSLVEKLAFPQDVVYDTIEYSYVDFWEYEIPLKVTFWAADNVPNEPEPSLPGNKEVMVVTNVPSNAAFQFAVKSWDECKNLSDISNVITVQAGDVGIELNNKHSAEPVLRAFPNPANSLVKFVFFHPGIQRYKKSGMVIRIYDIQGRLVKQVKPVKSTGLDFHFQWQGENSGQAQMPSGIYFYKLKFRDYRKTGSFLMVR